MPRWRLCFYDFSEEFSNTCRELSGGRRTASGEQRCRVRCRQAIDVQQQAKATDDHAIAILRHEQELILTSIEFRSCWHISLNMIEGKRLNLSLFF